MKYQYIIFLVVFFWINSLSVFSQRAELVNIFTTAKAQDKNILIYIHATWCTPCRELEKYILPCQSIVDSLHNFIFVSTSLDKSTLGAILSKKYGITYVPTFLLLSPDGELLHYQTGIETDTTHFLKLMSDFKEKKRIIGFSANFDIKYPQFYNNYFPFSKNAIDSSAITCYLEMQTDLENEVNFNILRTIFSGGKYLRYILIHSTSYSEKFGPLYFQTVEHLYLSNINRLIREKDTLNYHLFENALYLVDSLQGHNQEWLKNFRYISFLGRSGADWLAYSRQIDLWEEKYGNSNIQNFCFDIYNFCSDTVVCKKMAKYLGISLSTMKEPDEDIYFKYAVLLRKGGQTDLALNVLKKALALSQDDEKKIILEREWNNQIK